MRLDRLVFLYDFPKYTEETLAKFHCFRFGFLSALHHRLHDEWLRSGFARMYNNDNNILTLMQRIYPFLNISLDV